MSFFCSPQGSHNIWNNSGNILVIAATASIVVALSRAGIQHPWSSAQVLIPLILGLLGLAGFLVYEAFLAKHPIVRAHH